MFKYYLWMSKARTLSLIKFRGGPVKKVLGGLCTNLKEIYFGRNCSVREEPCDLA